LNFRKKFKIFVDRPGNHGIITIGFRKRSDIGAFPKTEVLGKPHCNFLKRQER
jgi:hypothetical protein